MMMFIIIIIIIIIIMSVQLSVEPSANLHQCYFILPKFHIT
jgi:hypothetical protein